MFFKARYKFGEITKRWGDVNFKKEFDGVLDDWLKQFSKEEKPVLLELLRNFYYYTEKAIDKKVVELYNKFIEIHGEDTKKILFAKVPKEYGVANSDMIFSSFWWNNGIKGASSNDVVREFLEQGVNPKTLVIMDDYMGSGDTIVSMLEKILTVAPEMHNSKFYILLIHTAVIGKQRLEEFSRNIGLDLTLVYLDITDKAFQEDYIFSKIDAKLKEKEYVEICDKKQVGKGAVLGYKDVQSLVSFQKTTPNDTLGLFWHSANNFVSLFRKNIVFRNSYINELKGVAKKNANKEGVLFDIKDNQYNKFIVYCIIKGASFSFAEACNDFGVVPELLSKRLEYINERGYIKIENGKILPSSEIEKKIIKSRLKGWERAEEMLIKEEKIPLKENSYIPPNFSESFKGYRK